jgi:hypothetical protein
LHVDAGSAGVGAVFGAGQHQIHNSGHNIEVMAHLIVGAGRHRLARAHLQLTQVVYLVGSSSV